MAKKLSRNAPCPCGSGKKYKHCCIRKDFDWVELDDGGVGRRVELTKEAQDAFETLGELQRAHYGRNPERIFEGAPPLEHMEHWTVEAMKKAGIEPALIYAYEKTNGMLLSERNESRVPDTDIAEWEAAIDQYEADSGCKVTRRRLNDRDLELILENGPKDHSQIDFIRRLPIPPPFSKDKWESRPLSHIIEDADCFDYFQKCVYEAKRSGRADRYLRVFFMMANLGQPPNPDADLEKLLKESLEQDYSVDELRHALESLVLTCEPKRGLKSAAAAFEFLAIVGDFMNSYAEQIGASEELSNSLVKVNGLALLAFGAAVNAELGIRHDIWDVKSDGRESDAAN